jgi:NAD(P)H dehydrogenase (quinone)
VLRDDVADALAAILTAPGHDGATYELTGPEALTLAEAAAELSRTSDRTVSYVDETLEEARASRARHNAPAWELDGWITTYTASAAGEFDVVTDHVRRLTGHEPVGVREFTECALIGGMLLRPARCTRAAGERVLQCVKRSSLRTVGRQSALR